MTPYEAVSTLIAAFQKDLSAETVAIYAKALGDVDPDLLGKSVADLVAGAKFFPAVSEVRRTAARIAGLLPPASGEILALIRRADVRETIFRRDGSPAYVERYWRWPDEATPSMVALCETVLNKSGEPCDEEGKDHFGWENDAKKIYESDLPALESNSVRDLSTARLLKARDQYRLGDGNESLA